MRDPEAVPEWGYGPVPCRGAGGQPGGISPPDNPDVEPDPVRAHHVGNDLPRQAVVRCARAWEHGAGEEADARSEIVIPPAAEPDAGRGILSRTPTPAMDDVISERRGTCLACPD